MKKNEAGFGNVVGLLILVIVVLAGAVGWYVYHTNKSHDSSKTTTNQPVVWRTYSSAQGGYTIQHPSSWSTASKGCGGSLLLLGANSNALGKCGSIDLGQMTVMSIGGDSSVVDRLTTGYGIVSYQKETVQGVSGYREIGVASGQTGTQFGRRAVPDGTKVVEYVFYTHGKTYTAIYTQLLSYPDVLSDFDHMISKTLQFHS